MLKRWFLGDAFMLILDTRFMRYFKFYDKMKNNNAIRFLYISLYYLCKE